MIAELGDAGQRLDKVLVSHFPAYSRTYFQTLIENQLVLVNGQVVKKRILIQEGDEIEIEFALTPEINLEPENIALTILFEDEELLVINKPAHMVVHPGAGNPSHTFVNALLYHCKTLPQSSSLRPGIVHRLDKETSGVLVAAKTERAHQKLVELFATRQVKKSYIAICIGNPGQREIEGPIGRHPTKRKEMSIVASGKSAKTLVKTVGFDGTLSVVHLEPFTGRTHQLRVHLKSVGTPILGDKVYGSEKMNEKWHIERQLLHAQRLEFNHPLTGAPLVIEAPLPEDFLKMYRSIMHP